MNTHIGNQYSTGLSRHNIEQALIATGKDLSNLERPVSEPQLAHGHRYSHASMC
jgi:hypothetical protein